MLHAGTVTLVPQLKTTVGAAVTVNVLVQDCVCPQLPTVYVHVTSLVAPQAEGGLVVDALFVSTPLHPPLAVVDAKNVVHAAFTAA